jgi:large subunit ribosomal protein L15
MIELSNLQPALGSIKNKKKRLGRGQSSGKGGTSTRGHKGAKSRSGNYKKLGFEGGQMPLQRRIPKFGFNNFNRKKNVEINLDVLQNIIDKNKLSEINMDYFIKIRLAKKNDLIKILGRGEIKTKIKIYAHKFSKKAIILITKIGGEPIIINK